MVVGVEFYVLPYSNDLKTLCEGWFVGVIIVVFLQLQQPSATTAPQQVKLKICITEIICEYNIVSNSPPPPHMLISCKKQQCNRKYFFYFYICILGQQNVYVYFDHVQVT